MDAGKYDALMNLDADKPGTWPPAMQEAMRQAERIGQGDPMWKGSVMESLGMFAECLVMDATETATRPYEVQCAVLLDALRAALPQDAPEQGLLRVLDSAIGALHYHTMSVAIKLAWRLDELWPHAMRDENAIIAALGATHSAATKARAEGGEMNAEASHTQATPWRAAGKTIQDAEGRTVATALGAADARLLAQAPRMAAILWLFADWRAHGADGPIETWGAGAIWNDVAETLRNAGKQAPEGFPIVEARNHER